MRDLILRTAAKATASAVVTFVGTVAGGYADDGLMSQAEWWTAASLALAAGYATWQVPNRPANDGS